MNSRQQTLQQLISPEILVEIQTSFLKKYGAAICLFDKRLEQLIDFPAQIPALAALSDEQQNLFDIFIDLASLDAELLQKHTRQSFANHTINRFIFPILFNDDFMGLAVLLDFTKDFNRDTHHQLLQTLSLIKHKNLALRTLQDESPAQDEEIKTRVQELQNIIHLFIEAGIARANVSASDAIGDVETTQPKQTAILFCDPNGQIVDSAFSAAKILGYADPGALSDLNFPNDVLATDYDREKFRMLFQVDAGATTSVALLLQDGSTAQVDVQVNVQKTATGIVGFECLLFMPNDLTASDDDDPQNQNPHLQHDENHLTALQAIYRRLQHQLAQVASPLSHKLGRFFKVAVDDAGIKKQLSDIQQLTKSLSHLNQQLACFALDAAPQVESIDLNRLIRNIAEQLSRRAPDSITIKTQFEKELPRVSANPELLVHAIGNLCKNALEAMRNGTLRLETRAVPSENEGHSVELCIQDSGMGIPALIQNHLFEPFYTTKKHMNAGLGLAAAYGIIKSHAGQINIQSEPGVGTRISIVLPAVDAASDEKKPHHQESRKNSKGTVLIIDDEKEIAEVTAMALKRGGYDVFTCTTCKAAVEIIRETGDKLDLFIVDNQLVGATGVSCAQDLMAKLPAVPILFYSGAEEDLELMQFINQHGAGWLKKPFTAKELLSQVESLIFQHQHK